LAKRSVTITAAWITGGFVLIAAIISGLFGLCSDTGPLIESVSHSGSGDINIYQGISIDSLRQIISMSDAGGVLPTPSNKVTENRRIPISTGLAKPSGPISSLATRIERALSPSGAIVTAPDSIRDKVTGELREVDASIRYDFGTAPLLAVMDEWSGETPADGDWIEQLAGKSRSIGAHVTYAISTNGFTDAALRKADFFGIQVRTLAALDQGEVTGWLRTTHVQFQRFEWQLVGLELELYDAPAETIPNKELQREFRENPAEAGILIRNIDGKRFSVRNILIEWTKRNGDFYADVPINGRHVKRELHQPFERGGLHTLTDSGAFDIKVMHMRLDLARTWEAVPITRLIGYHNEQDELVQVVEWNLNEGLVLSLFRELSSGMIKVDLSQGRPSD
jgi:hypothetical protein